jgi:hypothetical protein
VVCGVAIMCAGLLFFLDQTSFDGTAADDGRAITLLLTGVALAVGGVVWAARSRR